MRLFIHQQLKKILRALAILTVLKYKPGIIGVTGSVGKTSTKEAIVAVLKNFRRVRGSSGNFNNEIGLPLTILGDWDYVGGAFFWTRVFCSTLRRLIFRSSYPEVLVLEYAADRPGDIKYLLSIARPHISVVTAVGDVPAHVEFYNNPEEVAREKARLIEALPTAGFAILNRDDEDVYAMREKTRAHVMTFGFEFGSEVRISSFEIRKEKRRPVGISFKLEYGGSFVPVRIDGVLGQTHGYAAAAAAAVGIGFGINLVRISEALAYYRPPDGRMHIMRGVKNIQIVDDSYNASLLSMKAAIATVKECGGSRLIGVLGDMLEIGKYTAPAHEEVGRLSARTFDILFTVGARARLIAEAANKNGLARKRIYSFESVEDAVPVIKKVLKKGDLVLCKASRRVGLDKAVEALKLNQPD